LLGEDWTTKALFRDRKAR